MRILNAMQVKAGAKIEKHKNPYNSQPRQFISSADKDFEWAKSNLDWLEWQGIKSINNNARRMIKSLKLAEGIIDPSDYIPEEDNESADLVEQLTDEEPLAYELKFFPIIPNAIKLLCAEFAKRNSKVSFRATDEYTNNEILSAKSEMIKTSLLKDAERKVIQKMIAQGLDVQAPENQEMLSAETNPEKLKTLPQIQEHFSNNYEVTVEKWAAKQHEIDVARFHMDEMEEEAFYQSLVVGREFWHFAMLEDDYDIELWNPSLTFYHKSPNVKYISEGNFVGKIEIQSIPTIIDKHGWKMKKEQVESLENQLESYGTAYGTQGVQAENFYDSSRSHKWNTEGDSLQFRQMTAGLNDLTYANDSIGEIYKESENYHPNDQTRMLRVTESYWKTQRRLGHLTRVNLRGEAEVLIVDEDYKITDAPEYNLTLYKTKSVRNLIFGEHIEWIYVNEVWGGIKIGPQNILRHYNTDDHDDNSIYIGMNQNEIGPMKFQFKGDKHLYDAKLPVEGRVFGDSNVRSTTMVDRMMPYQIGFNLVNNQIADILVDEIGTVLTFDQNTLPQNSLGEDWGKNNYAKAYVSMKDFGVLPLDNSLSNTENAINGAAVQTLDLSQTQRLMSRVQLANYFKQEAFASIGITPQRLGEQIGQTDTATGVEQSVTGSHAQTEMYFIQHSDYLMPRVHQMRSDLSQYYHSTKSSVRLQTSLSDGERANFQISGTDLLGRDINVYCSTSAENRVILEKMRSLAANNNTTGASLYELGSVMQASSIGTLNSIIKKSESKADARRQEDMQHQEKLKQMEVDSRKEQLKMEQDFETKENDKRNRTNILISEIKSSGFGSTSDMDGNGQNDFLDAMDGIRKTDAYIDTVGIQEKKANNDAKFKGEEINLKREDMQLKRDLKQTDLAIARENKNSFDNKDKKEKKKE